jgi:hypothetical protein
VSYQVDILYRDLTYRATIRNLVSLDGQKHFLEYGQSLSGIGKCKFRIGTKDPILSSEGNILQPFKYHVRIKRFGVTIWQGVIVRVPRRNHNFIEVEARTYLYLLDRINIRHDAPDGNGGENYRTFKSGTLADAITTLINEAKADMGAPLSSMTIGTIDNPSFPADFKDSAGSTLSGPWTFSNTFQLKFDYRSTFYVIQMLATYGNFDFEATSGMVFNFKNYIGNKQPQLVFSYLRDHPERNNLEDYDAPLDGNQMANFLQGIAADNQNIIIHAEQSDQASINDNGKIMGVAAYGDVKNINLLNARLKQELTQVKTPDPELHLVPNDRGYPLGQYGIGDTVSAKISDGIISVDSLRRVVDIDIKVHVSGNEDIRLITNKPRDGQ